MALRILLLLLMTVLPFALSACNATLAVLAGEPVNGSALPTDEWTGNHSTVGVATTVTARTPAEWDAMWQLTGNAAPGPLPDGKMAVAVFLGQRFTEGFKVEIEDAELTGRSGATAQPIVRWRELAPLATRASEKAVTSPWSIRLMTRSVLPPDFRKTG